MKKHLQQHISEFLAQLIGVAAVHRVEQLVGFLQQVAAQRVVRLLAFPRARGAQLVHHGDRVDKPFAWLRVGRRDQPVAGCESGLHGGMVGIGGQQDRRVVAGMRRPGGGQRPRHLDRHLFGVLHVTRQQQFDRLDRDQRRAARVDQHDCHGACCLSFMVDAPPKFVISTSDCGLPSSANTKPATIATSSRSRIRGAPTPPPDRGIGT